MFSSQRWTATWADHRRCSSFRRLPTQKCRKASVMNIGRIYAPLIQRTNCSDAPSNLLMRNSSRMAMRSYLRHSRYCYRDRFEWPFATGHLLRKAFRGTRSPQGRSHPTQSNGCAQAGHKGRLDCGAQAPRSHTGCTPRHRAPLTELVPAGPARLAEAFQLPVQPSDFLWSIGFLANSQEGAAQADGSCLFHGETQGVARGAEMPRAHCAGSECVTAQEQVPWCVEQVTIQ